MPLDRILQRLRAHAAQRPPVAIFDLDSTLLSTQQRNFAIVREYAAHPDASPRLRELAAALVLDDLRWNPMEDLRTRGLDDEHELKRLRRFWLERFFTSEYLRHDEPLPGAAEFVRDTHAAGAVVVYLTGRPHKEMGDGTRESLASHGFPLDDGRAHLMLKPTFHEPDLPFKRRALEAIATLGHVVAAFENEPANANLFIESFPEADVVLLETVHSPGAPPLDARVSRVKHFLR